MLLDAQVVACVIMVCGYGSAYLLLRCSGRFGASADKAEAFHRRAEAWWLDALYRLCIVLGVVCLVVGTWGLARLVLEF